uniref:C-type lectin domain-containing protein n=1 Tax=Cyprinus carpio TaxID=7962 RepID=A0A8C1UPX4_CYPCA
QNERKILKTSYIRFSKGLKKKILPYETNFLLHFGVFLFPHLNAEHLCTECGKGWLRFENTCYFLSQNRFTWQQSRQECQRLGGDLAVITNERVKGSLHYWIGLNHLGTNEWTWINNTVSTVRWENNYGSNGTSCFLKCLLGSVTIKWANSF